MPLPMVHLAVANEVQKKLEIDNVEDFYVGNLAPDAIHMRENTGPEDKSKTHLYFKDFSDEEKMKENINSFYESEVKSNNIKHNIFTLGYCSHLITDFFWFKTVFKLFESKLPKDIDHKEFRSSYYFDTDHIDSKIYHWSDWTSSAMNVISKADNHSNIFLSVEEIKKWIERTINWFSDDRFPPDKDTKYLTYKEIQDFIEKTSSEVTFVINDVLLNKGKNALEHANEH